MSGPWEKYKTPPAGPAGPWEKYKNASPEQINKELGGGYLEDQQNTFMNALDKGLKALGYAAGHVRNAGAQTVEAAANAAGYAPGIAKPGDLERTMAAEAPSTKEYMMRAGLPEGPHLSEVIPAAYSDTGEGLPLQKGGWADPTPLGAVGLVGDAASDPLTYASMGASVLARAGRGGKAIQVANRILNPIESFAAGGGKALFKSGVKNIDTRLVEKGMEPVSPYLLEQGIWGGPKGLQKGMNARMETLAAERKALYDKISASGVTIDPAYASQEARALVEKIRQNPYMKPKAEKASEFLDLATEPMSVQQASDVKTALYNSLPAEAFNPDGSLSDIGQQLMRSLSSGYKTEIEKAAEFAQKGGGQQVTDINKEWGSYLNAAKPTKREIAKEERKNLFTQVKAALLKLDPTSAAAMYGAQALNSGAVRTGAGLVLDRTLGPIGRTAERLAPGLTDATTRNLLWEDMQNKYRQFKGEQP